MEDKIPDVSSLATKTSNPLTTVENKRLINSWVKKTEYDTKITEIRKKTYWS